MVYCGKPSKSCRNCRNRDIKCDKRKDSCGQCIRTHIICPGYPDPRNLVFKDETKRVAGKAVKDKKPPPKCQGLTLTTPSIPSELPSSRNNVATTSSTQLTLPLLSSTIFTISNSLEERAKSFFFTHAFSPLHGIPTYSLLRSFSPPHPLVLHLLFAARAVSLAYFSKYHHPSFSIMQRARLYYVAALKHTQGMLSDPEGAKKDSMLVSVLFLDIFEKLARSEKGSEKVGRGEDGSEKAGHLDGAMALVRFRGEHQFNSEIAMSLFQQLSSGVLSSCLEREVEVPTQFIAVRRLAARSRNTSDLGWRFEEVLVRLISLRVGIKNGIIGDDRKDAIARELENECLELCHLQNHQIPTTVMEKGYTPSNHYTESTTINHRILNHLYIIRLTLAEIPLRSPPSPYAIANMAALCRSIYTSATDIVSFTTPQVLFFPLYIAARSQFCPSALGEQITELMKGQDDIGASKIVCLLERKGKVTGVQEGNRRSNPWSEFSGLGLGELSLLGGF